MKDIEVFDTLTDKFLPTNCFGKLTNGRCSCGIIERNGIVYITGGYKKAPKSRSSEMIQGVETLILKSRIGILQDCYHTDTFISSK